MGPSAQGAYGVDNDIVDYILGITFEIWEERGVDLIYRYYSDGCPVYGLDGITTGAAEVVDATCATLDAFPDRNLLVESVIWSGNTRKGFTSHRLSSRGTNDGSSRFGDATHRTIRMTNIADCEIAEGVIVREWLIRDNLELVRQLGADPMTAAAELAAHRSEEHTAWLASEHRRVAERRVAQGVVGAVDPRNNPAAFARKAIGSAWRGDAQTWAEVHAPYSVMHRGPFTHFSGREAIFDYYKQLRNGLGEPRFSVDSVVAQHVGNSGIEIAARWSVAGYHQSELFDLPASGRPVYVMGATHYQCFGGRIVAEHTVFDGLAVISQLLDTPCK